MLNKLVDLLEKKGENFVNKFLSEELIITEKLDTYRILFEKKNGELIFYKKDNSPLNLISRVLTNVWEDAIIELNTIIGDTKLPENMRFGVAYTPVERPIRIPYSKLPKYILTDITLRKDNKVVEVYEYDEVNKWASLLNMGRPPIIFEGKLSEEQIDILKKYDLGEFDKLKEKNFAKLIKNLFEKSYSNEDIIEGIIIKNNKDLVQIVSYEFKLLNEAYEKNEHSRDFYDMILLKINSFMDTYNFPILEGTTSDEMYLEIVSDIFNTFCEKNPTVLEDINPKYLSPPSYGYFGELNLLLIKNKKTINILENGSKIHEALFRVILSSLRKPKKEFGLLTEAATKKFNTFVFLIRNIINEENILKEEPKLITESIINEARSENIVIDALSKRNPSDVDNMRVIASIQKAFEPAILNIEKGNEKVVVYITECQPFTNSQVENILAINRTWRCPVILVSISNERRITGKRFHLSDVIVKAQLNSVAIFNREIIPAYFMIDNWNLLEIFEYCRPKYEPITIITDKGKKSNFAIQLYFEDEVMGGRIGVEQNFNIGEMEVKEQLEAFRAIEDNLFIKFKESTPQPIWGLYDSMQAEYRTWSGAIISNTFQETKLV